jgi:hypothetical protein
MLGSTGSEQIEGKKIGERLGVVHRVRQMLTVHVRPRTEKRHSQELRRGELGELSRSNGYPLGENL